MAVFVNVNQTLLDVNVTNVHQELMDSHQMVAHLVIATVLVQKTMIVIWSLVNVIVIQILMEENVINVNLAFGISLIVNHATVMDMLKLVTLKLVNVINVKILHLVQIVIDVLKDIMEMHFWVVKLDVDHVDVQIQLLQDIHSPNIVHWIQVIMTSFVIVKKDMPVLNVILVIEITMEIQLYLAEVVRNVIAMEMLILHDMEIAMQKLAIAYSVSLKLMVNIVNIVVMDFMEML
jgi:hypothetical protein